MEIPSPPTLPFLGNMADLDKEQPLRGMIHLADTYGPIVRLHFPTGSRIVVFNYELLNEICDEKRFHKRPAGALLQVRNGISDGLFTAFGHEENWGLAHRILMPHFGPLAMNKMFEEMHEVTCQMISKWARLGPTHRIDPADQFTRLTLDSIAICALDTRFNSFDKEELHPFIDAMAFFLRESGLRAGRPQFLTDYVYRQSTKDYWESIEKMKAVALAVINDRRANPNNKADLVDAMLNQKDPKTGKGMPEENIVANMITFLIAGHETTSGLLSFLTVLLCQNPRAMAKLQQEVDQVLGDDAIRVEHVNKMPYLTACLRETLRLWPTAVGFQVTPNSTEDADFPMFIGKERYIVNKGDILGCQLPRCQRDPALYGEDAEEFKPERMLDESFNKLPPNAWKPFGNGARACIGRAFAWQESHIVMALIVQNFSIRAEDPSYKMEINQTLTIKPKDFHFFAKLRDGLEPHTLERRLWAGRAGVTQNSQKAKDKKLAGVAKAAVKKSPFTIFHGSNTGTCTALAQNLAGTAAAHGYDAVVKPMDAAVNDLPRDHPVVIISASYEGEPPDNAGRFVVWLKEQKGDSLKGVKYAVFGCGHSDWASTYQKIPTFVDDQIVEHGGKRICERGLANAANNDMFNDFDAWSDSAFWTSVAKEFGEEEGAGPVSHGLDIEISTSTRSSDLRQDVAEAIVQKAYSLTAPGEPDKRHIEILLPTGMTYTSGDYLAVLPMNHNELVKTVMARFKVPWDAKIMIKEGQHTPLPTGREMPVYGLLASYVELNQPVTQKNVAAIAQYLEDETIKSALNGLTAAEIADKRISILDLLEMHPDIQLPFGDFLAMLPTLRVRQYSISSSPLASADSCTLTYGVLDQEAKAGTGKRFKGIASTYLSELQPGDVIRVAVKASHQAFHLPLEVEKVPVIMVCAGSGLAPFHGFVQERAKQIEAGRALAPALLFVGCRHPDRDALYADDFARWQDIGAVDVRHAFSRASADSLGCRYVQDRLWTDREEARLLWDSGARFYVCGNSEVGEAVRDVVVRTYMEYADKIGKTKTREESEAWFASMRNERFASDVFA